MGLTDAERAEIRRVLREARPKPRPPLQPVPPAKVKADQRWNEDNTPSEAIYSAAAVHTEAAHRRYEKDTAEERRRQQEAKELARWTAEGEQARIRYQRELDRWWQAKRDFEAALLEDDYVYVGGFREPRYKASCHRGPGDPDYGL